MSGVVLVINCGSSSLKLALLEPESGKVLHSGLAERLGSARPELKLDAEPSRPLPAGAEHGQVMHQLLASGAWDLGGLLAVGHRVVHGGEAFSDSVVLDAAAVAAIEECSPLAPLHNPANLLGIQAAREHLPGAVHVAVFDTAFHQTLPPKAFLYALPYELYESERVRRYGFHGTSHRYVAGEAARRLGRPLQDLALISAHLGNGCSACAILDGRSVDTSMGLTPLEGLVMGTRSGDVDPNLHDFLARRTGRSLSQTTELLNRQSGLLGLSGESNDMRTLLQAAERGHARAQLAIDVFCYRLAKGILGLCAALPRLDAVLFTGGIGEHAAGVRQAALEQLGVLGAVVDPAANQQHGRADGGRITSPDSRLQALVIPTNEELVIAREAARLAAGLAFQE